MINQTIFFGLWAIVNGYVDSLRLLSGYIVNVVYRRRVLRSVGYGGPASRSCDEFQVNPRLGIRMSHELQKAENSDDP